MGEGVAATGYVILLNAASYAAVVVSLSMMRADELNPVPPLGRAKGQLRDGIRYVRSRPDILLVMAIVFCCGTFGLNFQMTTALMATEVYGKGAGEYGLLGSIIAVGSLAGSLLAARRRQPRQRLIVVGAVAFGVIELVAGLMPSYLTFALMLPLCGLAALTVITAANAFVQMTTTPAMRGRVMALYMAIFMGGTPIGAAAARLDRRALRRPLDAHRRRRPHRHRHDRRHRLARQAPGRAHHAAPAPPPRPHHRRRRDRRHRRRGLTDPIASPR